MSRLSDLPERATELSAIALFVGILAGGEAHAQQSHVNGGEGVQVGDSIVTHLAGHTLTIPKGYISSFMGYASNLQIRALLPCLLPETAENTAEFHKTTYGRVLTANLNPLSDNPYRLGQALLDKIIEGSAFAKSGPPFDYAKFIKTYDPGHRDPAIGPNAVLGSKFVVYDDAFMKRDIFVLPNSVPLLMIECKRHIALAGHAECEGNETAPGDLHLWYWYDGSFVDADVDFAATIDARLHRLLGSFLTATPKQTACDETRSPIDGESKYPPAKPGALDCWPLKAAGQIADATCEV